MNKIVRYIQDITAIIEFIDIDNLENKLRVGYNATVLIKDKKLIGTKHMMYLTKHIILNNKKKITQS